jgi:type IV pilus assembly protein PilM
MPSTKTVWGIDVGQCALKAIKLQWRDNKLRALAFDVIEHAKILSQPDADEQALIRSALAKFLSRNSIKGSTLVIGVPGQASFTRFIKLPPVEMRKIPEIVRYEARQQIPFNLEDVVWDYQTISPPSAGPREVEVGIFAMKRDIVADYVSDFLAMRIEPDIVQMAPVALYNFLRYDRKDATGATILIDVGAENTNLVIADGDRVWIRNVPLGGNNFTQALAKEFKLPFSKAENLKRHAAESKHARQVFQAMRPVFGDLLTEIQRSIGYYTSLHRDSRIERIMAMGNAFRLAGLMKFISQNLGVEVVKVEEFSSLSDAEALAAPLFRENVLSFGVVFGLAIQGCGLASIQTSLLPPEILNAKIMRRKRAFFVAAGAAVLAAVGCFAYDQFATYGQLAGGANEVKRLAGEVDGLMKDNTAEKEKFDVQKKALLAERAKIGEIEKLVDNETYAYEVLRTVWDAWPYDKRWETYDPATNTPPRSSLSIIEMLSMTAHYVPDVRAFAEQAGGGAAAAGTPAPETPPAEGAAPATPAAQAPAKGGPLPGMVVEIYGITPKTGQDGLKFVNENLMANLKKCRRTVELPAAGGEKEVLARMVVTGVFKNQPDYQDFAPRTTGAPAAPAQIGKGDDFWFKAQWVVEVGQLREEQRRQVFPEVARIVAKTGLAAPSLVAVPAATLKQMLDQGELKDADARAVKDLVAQDKLQSKLEERDREADALAQVWLVDRDQLGKIAAEGVIKDWPRESTPAPK